MHRVVSAASCKLGQMLALGNGERLGALGLGVSQSSVPARRRDGLSAHALHSRPYRPLRTILSSARRPPQPPHPVPRKPHTRPPHLSHLHGADPVGL
jgi:hypothetical protein